MTSKLARRNGQDGTYLLMQSSGVLHSYPHRRIVNRRQKQRGLAIDFVRTWLLPSIVVLILVAGWITLYWLGVAIDRAVRSLP